MGFVGGAAGGALVAAAAGASAPWIVGGALIGAGLGTGTATLGNQGQADAPPSVESFDDFLANPPGAARTWRNPANDDHGTVTIAAEMRAVDGRLYAAAKPFDGRQDILGGLGPAEGLRVCIATVYALPTMGGLRSASASR